MKTKLIEMKNQTAIKVDNLSKSFRIPHEKINTMRGAFVSAFRKKGYEEFKALDNVSFEVKKGEFFGIIGRNGSGKSTLLKILAGIYTPDSGKIEINDHISPFLELGIGFNPELSGRDNIYLNATVLGLSRKQIDEKFDDIVRFSELERFIDQKLKNYSSGMSVRLAFSVAIHANRDILLMDEVLAVGDTNFQKKCLLEFNKYKKQGKTVVLVTHDMFSVTKYCDRVMVLDEGENKILSQPKSAVTYYLDNNRTKSRSKVTKQDRGKGDKTSDKKDEGVEIGKVEFFDNQGSGSDNFRIGDDVVIRINFHAKEKIKNPVFGIAIYNQDGVQITGPNTLSSGISIQEIEGDGHLDFIIHNCPLFSGQYFITVAIHDESGSLIYDIQERAFSFFVDSLEKNQRGLIKLDHEWRINK